MTPRRVFGGLGLALALGAAAFAAIALPRQQQLATGAMLYGAHCATCHGVKLEGQPDWRRPGADGRLPAPPHDVNGHTWHHSDADLFLITKKGVEALVSDYQSNMPAFEGALRDDEILAIIEYVKSTWPERQRSYQRDRTRVAQAGPQARTGAP